jgi:hypothetical protein
MIENKQKIKEREKKKILKTHYNSNNNTYNTIIKIPMRRIHKYYRKSTSKLVMRYQ